MGESVVNLKNIIHQLTLENRKLKDALICEEKKYKRKILDLEYKLKIYELEYNIDVDKVKKFELKYDINMDKSTESDSDDKENGMMKRSESKLSDVFNYFISQNQIMKHQEVNVATTGTNEAKKSKNADNHCSIVQSPKVVKKEEPVVQHKPSSNNKATSNPKENTTSWKNDCLLLIDAILDNPDSGPFREPISSKDYPNYKSVIKEPMDFGTIREKLVNDEYKSINEFDYDCNLVFINSEIYFTNKKSKIYAMTLRLADFYDSCIDEISKTHKQELKIQPFVLPNKKPGGGGDLMSELLNLTAEVDRKRADSDNSNAFKSPGFFYYRPKNKKNTSNQPKHVEDTIETQMESTRDEDDENEKPVKQEARKDVTTNAQKRNRKQQFSYKESSSSTSESEEDVKKQIVKQTTPRTHKKQRRSDVRHSIINDSV